DQGEEAGKHGLPGRSRSHCQQRESRDVELVSRPLREVETAGVLQCLPDRRDAVTQVAEVERRDKRRELRQSPQSYGDQTEIDESAGSEPLLAPAHERYPGQAPSVRDARQRRTYAAAGRGGGQVGET